jgi:hypothetical protein
MSTRTPPELDAPVEVDETQTPELELPALLVLLPVLAALLPLLVLAALLPLLVLPAAGLPPAPPPPEVSPTARGPTIAVHAAAASAAAAIANTTVETMRFIRTSHPRRDDHRLAMEPVRRGLLLTATVGGCSPPTSCRW